MLKRKIGHYEGKEKGALFFVFGAMHGNELAGIKAMDFLLKMLEVEPITNPNFIFKGKIIGLKGHTRAIEQGKRFINRDLNRMWTKENVTDFFSKKKEELEEESLEIKEIISTIQEEINIYQPEKIFFLDIHTTSAQGGIFSIPANDEVSLRIAERLNAPVICGLLDGLTGTSLHYFNSENMGIPTAAVCFEAGQHDDALSVNRAIAAIIYAMEALDCIKITDINNQHLKILNDYAENLPKITHFCYRHAVKADDDFMMEKGFLNFQNIKKGTLLARDKNGAITAPEDCRILMPLYQKQGEDGFFLVK
jgi:succinylglutamate desuccinylase